MSRHPFLPDYLDDAMGPFRRIREQADMLANIYKPAVESAWALERQLSSLVGNPISELLQQQHQMLDSLYGRSKGLTEGILGSSRLHSTVDDQIQALLRPPILTETLGLAERLGIQQRSISDSLTAALAGIGVRDQIDAIFGSTRQPMIERELSKMLDFVRGTGVVSFDPVAQTLSVGGAVFPISDFEDEFDDAASEAADSSDAARLKMFLQIVLARAVQLKGNKAVAFALIVLVWLSKTVLEGQIQTISGEVLRPVTDAIIRKLKPEVREQVVAVRDESPLVDIRTLRLVIATNLQVRVSPRRDNSRIVARVSTPTVVMVIRHHKDWTLVQYRDGDAIVRGWVFTRYLTTIEV